MLSYYIYPTAVMLPIMYSNPLPVDDILHRHTILIPFQHVVDWVWFGSMWVRKYSLFTLRKPRSPLIIIGERGFLRVNRL